MAVAANALTRALTLIGFFTGSESVWTIEQMADRLGTSARTVYRDVRALKEAGFLDPVSSGGYTLGPAFVHYDCLLRATDPLIHVAVEPMQALLAETRQDAALVLCRRFRDCVMCVHQEHGPLPHRAPAYQRGVTIPMFNGATSKAVLASLAPAALRRLYLDNEQEIREAAKSIDWKQFSAELSTIRAQGYAMTVGELQSGTVGIAAPLVRDGQVLGSLGLIFDGEAKDAASRYRTLIEAVTVRAATISESLAAPTFGMEASA